MRAITRGVRGREVIAGPWSIAALAAVVAGAGACKKSDDEGDPETARQVIACTRALDEATAASGRNAVRALASDCPHACPGLEGWAAADDPDAAARALIAGCELACDEAAAEAFAAAAPDQRYRALVERCEASRYHLPGPDGHHMSDVWFVLDRIGQWLHASRGAIASDSEARAALEQATTRAHFPLPLPAVIEGLYRLPAAAAAAPPRTGFYVVIGGGEVRAAAVPVARLRGQGLELRPVPGGQVPGQPLPPARLGQAYAELVDAVRALHPEGAEQVPAKPLILADRATPLQRLLDVAASLEVRSFHLAVAAHGAWAHPVALERLAHASAAPLLQLLEGEYVVPAEADGDDLRIPRADVERMRSEVVHFAVMRAPLRKVELRVHPGTTVEELIPLLDALDDARIDAVLFQPDPTPPAPAPPPE